MRINVRPIHEARGQNPKRPLTGACPRMPDQFVEGGPELPSLVQLPGDVCREKDSCTATDRCAPTAVGNGAPFRRVESGLRPMNAPFKRHREIDGTFWGIRGVLWTRFRAPRIVSLSSCGWALTPDGTAVASILYVSEKRRITWRTACTLLLD